MMEANEVTTGRAASKASTTQINFAADLRERDRDRDRDRDRPYDTDDWRVALVGLEERICHYIHRRLTDAEKAIIAGEPPVSANSTRRVAQIFPPGYPGMSLNNSSNGTNSASLMIPLSSAHSAMYSMGSNVSESARVARLGAYRPGSPFSSFADDVGSACYSSGYSGFLRNESKPKPPEGAAGGKDQALSLSNPTLPQSGMSVAMSMTAEWTGRDPSRSESPMRRWSGRIVGSTTFEFIFGFFILSNAAVIGYQTNQDAVKSGSVSTSGSISWLEALNIVYTLAFAGELVLRILAEQRAFLWRSQNVVWNYFDTFVVLASIAEVSTAMILRLDQDSGSAGQLRILRIVKTARLIRVIRVTRIVRFIRALRTMVHQLLATLKSLVWAILLLLLVVYVFAILMTQAYAQHVQDEHIVSEELARYWSSIPRSMATLFQSVTDGISWNLAIQPLEDVGAGAVLLFVLYICFTQLAVLNVLTGVFCQSAIESAAHDHDLATQQMLENKNSYVSRLRAIFEDLDTDNIGVITLDAFRKQFKDERVQAYFESMDLDVTDVQALFQLLDSDGSETIEVDDFVEGCLRLKGGASNVNMAKLHRSQEVLDKRIRKFMRRTDEVLSVLLSDHHANRLMDFLPTAAPVPPPAGPRRPSQLQQPQQPPPIVPTETLPTVTERVSSQTSTTADGITERRSSETDMIAERRSSERSTVWDVQEVPFRSLLDPDFPVSLEDVTPRRRVFDFTHDVAEVAQV